MNYRQLLTVLLLANVALGGVPDTVGFEIGQIKGYSLLAKSGASSLYEVDCPQIDDSRPFKLFELVGTHEEVGYAYGHLLGKEILETYDVFLDGEFNNKVEKHLMELFLDWQYDNLIARQVPVEFQDELRGIQKAGFKEHQISRLRNTIERILVISSYPGDIGKDILWAMVDVFLEKGLRLTNPKLLNYVENNLFAVLKTFKKFLSRKAFRCSFMAAWGSRTKGGQLYTMRNLDWEANSGINKNKVVFVWKVKGTIPHATIGFPGVIGALTGMSQAGLTVHEAGLDSMKETELGLQWTLRLRYILMHSKNLAEAKAFWLETENTFGMNHMVASAADVKANGPAPVFVVETMRGYNAFFTDLDPREDGAEFVDPKTKHKFRAGYAMKDAVFRTNHNYDATISKFRTKLPGEHDSSILRYNIIKDSLQVYPQGAIGELQALNITANVADKAGDVSTFYHCPPAGSNKGNNILSAMFIPGESRMYVAIEYGEGKTYQPACCGVYLNMDLAPWFAKKSEDDGKESLRVE
jgi:hypothetical protein